MQFDLAVYAELCEYLNVLLSSQSRNSVYSSLEVRQTALLSLYEPLSAVAVAVEDYSLMSLYVLYKQIMQSCIEIVCLLEFVCEFSQRVSNDSVQYGIRTSNVQAGTCASELELVAGECERRCSVSIGGILREVRKRRYAHVEHGVSRCVIPALFKSLDNVLKLLAEEDRDDCRRCLVSAQSVVVTCRSHGKSQQVRILVNCLDDSNQECQELRVLHRRLTRIQQVLTIVSGQRPVIVLTRTVDSCERLLMEQANQIVLKGDLLHKLHCELVLIGSEVCRREYRSVLVLCRSHLVVLCLGGDAELPHMLVEILHVVSYAVLDRSEVVVVKFLSLGSRSAKQRSASEDQVLSLIIGSLVYQEVLLLSAYGCNYSLCGGIAEKSEYSQSCVGNNVHGAKQRSFLIQRFTGVGIECGRDIKRTALYECIGGRIPCGIASRLERCSDTAGREAGRIGLALDKLLAGELHDNSAVAHRGDEAVVLLSGDTGHRLEPVCVMCCTLLDRPVLHCACNYVGNAAV